MIEFDIITIFPHFFDSFLGESIIKRAQKQKLVKIKVFDLRKFAQNRHKTVDDNPFGGGRGMVLKIGPIYRALKKIKRGIKQKTILFSPRGKKFSQKTAYQYSKLKKIVLICGRYEGVDERVAKHLADEQVSIGDYVMMGGEVAAMAVIESVVRLVPKALGHSEQLSQRIEKKNKGFAEFPQYTRPEVFSPKKGKSWKAPKVLLEGNHKKIDNWRKKRLKIIH